MTKYTKEIIMKTAIITDSTATLSEELTSHPAVFQVYPSLEFEDGETFTDKPDSISPKEFYRKLTEVDTLPTTAQPSPAQFIDILDTIVAQEYDHVIFIHLSEKFSGTLETARMIARDYDGQLTTYFVDSKGVSLVMRNMIEQTLRLLDERSDIESIIDDLNWLAEQSTIYLVVEDLDNLVKGGRLGHASAFIGNLMQIKPLLKIGADGSVEMFEKIRTKRRVYKRFVHLIEEKMDTFDNKAQLYFAHGDAQEDIMEVINLLKEKHPQQAYTMDILTPIIGVHGGKGTIGMAVVPTIPS